MRKPEKRFEFRKRLLKVHPEHIRDYSLAVGAQEWEIRDGMVIDLKGAPGEVVLTAAKDFMDYLSAAMEVSVRIDCYGRTEGAEVSVRLDDGTGGLTLGDGYMGYRVTVQDGIQILAHDERGAAQALYYLEDLMTLRKAPFLEKGEVENRAMYSPRMVQSGFHFTVFPDEHLSSIAHAGMDAIMLPNNVNSFLDLNDLIRRAHRYGLDVYIQSTFPSKKHPDDEGAQEYYDSTYGELFKACPDIKGIFFVGESNGFPSKDPHTLGRTSFPPPDVLPDGKHMPGWWPCMDFPQLMEMVKKSIFRYNPKADIILWSYNWGWAPAEDRAKLIRALPKDITLMSTYEMFEVYREDGVRERTTDYTLSVVGPSYYFRTDAEVAAECGVRLYAMSNTAGQTWDFGVIPYEPFPDQWQRRYDSMKECWEKYGLCGLLESHTFGLNPSFISELTKWNFTLSTRPEKNLLHRILASHYGEEAAGTVRKALGVWSEAIRYYIAAEADQYGPFRVGPAYPLNFNKVSRPLHCSGGLEPRYVALENSHESISIPQIRIHHEIKSLKEMERLMKEGMDIMDQVADPNDDLQELMDIGKFIYLTVRTAIHTKEFLVARTHLDVSDNKEDALHWVEEMEKIARKEMENAKEAIPLVRLNSRLGWEQELGYQGDEEYIDWKIRQVQSMLDWDLGAFRRSLESEGLPLEKERN